MMTHQSIPEIVGLKISGTKATFKICLLSDMDCFQGHFPSQAILPGVAQIHWAVLWAQDLFSVGNAFSGMDQVKFHMPAKPQDCLDVSLEWQSEKSCVSFRYSLGERIVSSGRVRLK